MFAELSDSLRTTRVELTPSRLFMNSGVASSHPAAGRENRDVKVNVAGCGVGDGIPATTVAVGVPGPVVAVGWGPINVATGADTRTTVPNSIAAGSRTFS